MRAASFAASVAEALEAAFTDHPVAERMDDPAPLTIADLPALAAELVDLLGAIDPNPFPLVNIGAHASTSGKGWRVTLYGSRCVAFVGETLDDAVGQARAWLAYDGRAAANLAIGLAADGSFLPGAAG